MGLVGNGGSDRRFGRLHCRSCLDWRWTLSAFTPHASWCFYSVLAACMIVMFFANKGGSLPKTECNMPRPTTFWRTSKRRLIPAETLIKTKKPGISLAFSTNSRSPLLQQTAQVNDGGICSGQVRSHRQRVVRHQTKAAPIQHQRAPHRFLRLLQLQNDPDGRSPGHFVFQYWSEVHFDSLQYLNQRPSSASCLVKHIVQLEPGRFDVFKRGPNRALLSRGSPASEVSHCFLPTLTESL